MKLIITTTGVMLLAASAALAADAAVAEPPKNKGWDATATLGATVQRGNTDTSMVYVNALANKKWTVNEINLGLDGVYGDTDSETTSDSIRVFGQYNRLFTERIYGYFRVEGLHDGIADIDYRVILSPGAGYYFLKETNIFLRAELGPGYVFESLDGVEDDYATLRVGERFEWKINDRAKLWQSAEYVPQLDDFENYVVTFEIGIDTSITKRLSLTTFLQDIYRSEPAPGRYHNDMRLVAGVKYKLL